MKKISPIILAGVGVGAAYLLTRQRAADAAPPPPSTQGMFSRETAGVSSSSYEMGNLSQVFLPAKYGYVQPSMSGVASPTPTAWRDRMVGMPNFYSSSHGGDFRVFAGQVQSNSFKHRRTARRLKVVGVHSGVYAIPSIQSMRNYYGLRVGYEKWDSTITQLFRWDVIPINEQIPMYKDVIREGLQYLVPDTELSSSQFNIRAAQGQVSTAYQNRYGRTYVERDAFYHSGEAYVRTDGARGSLNWQKITDQNPDVIYFVSESGMVALNRRTMRRVPRSDLRPRYADLPYGAVPHAVSPWFVSPIQPSGYQEMSGGPRNDRAWWWSASPDVIEAMEGSGWAVYGEISPAPTDNWPGGIQLDRKRRIYPPSSTFYGKGIRLKKWATNTGNTRYGCRNNSCYLTSLTSGLNLPGGRGYKSSIFGGPGKAPFDFHAPAVLQAFIDSKLAFYNESIKFSGDE
tara:strand:+ start:216 stop:1586 length:1371 start_codon:yes stop_codon:yes gene_type:complete